MNKLLIINYFIFILVFLSGCSSVSYNLTMKNIGKQDMRNAKLMMDGYSFSNGWVSSKQIATHSRPEVSLGTFVNVIWQRINDDKIYQQKVVLNKTLPKLSRKGWYDFVFCVDDNNKVGLDVLVCSPDELCH
jgi:hypothetical protein